MAKVIYDIQLDTNGSVRLHRRNADYVVYGKYRTLELGESVNPPDHFQSTKELDEYLSNLSPTELLYVDPSD